MPAAVPASRSRCLSPITKLRSVSTGQCFIAFDPAGYAGERFFAQVEALVASIRAQDGARVPGDRRKANRVKTERDGVVVNPAQQASLGLA